MSYIHSIIINERGTLMGEWLNEQDFQNSFPPEKTWQEGRGDLLDQLNSAFKTALEPEAQAAFAAPYAIVRVLVEADELDLARAVIVGIEVPPELEEARAGLLAILGEEEDDAPTDEP
jgi:hypothetical protein